jgi:hypothetical protein
MWGVMANEHARQLRRNQTDAERKLWRSLRLLKSQGFHDVLANPDGVMEVVVASLAATPTPDPSPQGGGE